MSDLMPTVDILLATYNGGNYLVEQLESLLAQSYPHWRLLVRDDGSSDQTNTILLTFAKKHPEKIQIITDSKGSLKAKLNFFELLRYSQAPYIMFCDQDDVWLPNKIERSITHLQSLEQRHGKTHPILVYTDLKVVNHKLETIHKSMWEYTYIVPKRDQKWNRILTVNPATGCTTIFNQSLKQRVTTVPAEVIMHDWWLALMACFFGTIDFIPQVTILYRQHQNNVVGAYQIKKKKPHQYFNQDTLDTMRIQLQKAQQQAGAFADTYQQFIDKDKFQVIKDFSKLNLDDFLSSRAFLLKHDILKRDFATSIGFLLRV